MGKTRERRPGQGAALDGQTPKNNSTVANIAETRRRPQPLGLRTFWTEAGGLVRCTIIRRSDRQLWLALALHDKTATAFEYALKDWIAHAAEHRPVCLSCDMTFAPRSLPTDWAMLLPFQEAPTMPAAMLSGICARCSGKSDRELMDAALHDLRATLPTIRRIEVATETGRA